MTSPIKLFSRLATTFAFLIIASISPITAQEQSGTGWHYDGDGILTLSGSEVGWEELDVLKGWRSPVYKIVFAEDYSISAIPDYAFYRFKGLEEIAIPKVVTEIGNYAFYDCSISTITFPENLTSIGEYAFYSCDFTSIKIPDGVTTIRKSTFYSCCKLTSITLPKNLISIEDGAFECCLALTSITIPHSVTSIGYAAFGFCEDLTSVSLSYSLEHIANAAFDGCKSLTSLTLPASLTYIGGGAFDGCESLQSVEILSDGTPDNKHFIILGDIDPRVKTDKTNNGSSVFPSHQATLIYDPNTTWIGDDDTQNIRYYFDSFASQTSISTPTEASTSAPQFFDLGGRPVSPYSHKGLTIKRQGGRSSLISTK